MVIRDGTSLWAVGSTRSHRHFTVRHDAEKEPLLKVQISAAERERVYRRYTSNAEAYDLYLRGRSQTLRYSRDGQLAALEAFESVLKLQPDYAPAHAGLASASAFMRMRYAPEGEAKYWGERAMREAKRALELDPDLAEAHESLAAVYRFSEFDWERTIEESRRTLELNPSLDLPHYYRAVAYEHLGFLTSPSRTPARHGDRPEARTEPCAQDTWLLSIVAGTRRQWPCSRNLIVKGRGNQGSQIQTWSMPILRGRARSGRALLANSRELGGQIKQLHHAMLASFIAARGDKARAASCFGA